MLPVDTEGQCQIRDADLEVVDDLARIWFDGWQDAHAKILPTELAHHRTLESFRDRLADGLTNVRVALMAGKPIGFSFVKRDELNQLYVAQSGRGLGIAACLNDEALARISGDGFRVAWLACAIGNVRAARFYEKNRWQHTGTMISQLETPKGMFPLEVWRYEVQLCDV